MTTSLWFVSVSYFIKLSSVLLR